MADNLTASSASSTMHTYLLYKESGGNWAKLVDIKDYPATGGSPERVATTTLSNEEETNVQGVKSASGFEFLANYTVNDYKRVKNLEKSAQVCDIAIAFGKPTGETGTKSYGSLGVFTWSGDVAVWLEGGGVNGVREMRVSTGKLTDVEFSETPIVITEV